MFPSIFSLTSGQVPNDWEKNKNIRYIKKGPKLDPGDHRPISLLPVISKLLERIVNNQIYNYLTDTEQLTQEQSGLRKYHST